MGETAVALIGFEHIGMTVSNLDRSLAFYVDVLGLKLVVRRPSGGANEVCFLDTGNGMLEIIAPAAGARPAADVVDGHAGMRHMTLAYDDLDAIFARVKAAGAEIIEPPRLAFHRDILQRVAFCRDPDGIIVELCERSPSHPTR